ncbi:D-alanyl-D-alanine carboxypeptidase [Ornithinibacillus gellani]|uniref:D-alanyl-D-alanine carboxypeptidase family protein n=1 Tax=Ornithinibacillus gellani TaxID=2293253 RepID=UPI000F492F23|nr:D-alanyl-D-alanine carboxypeptidase family protein [Ornithinibacillus gellani]TQS74471.1 D-alanyl-D-alanine carboxypeptidase [Ornithinibacillus gellani]
MKKLALLFAILLIMTAFPSGVSWAAEKEQAADSPDLAPNSKSAILLERDTGTILYNKNQDEVLPPASMTKIMTMLLIMEELDRGNIKLEETIRISENAASMGGSQVFLEAGEEMSIQDLIKSIAIASGNDASVAMAERISGSEEAFVKRMNEKVTELGLKNTKFQNSSGLPAANHYSTAHDMAIIAKELLRYESVTKYTSIYEDYLRKGEKNEFWLVNTNKLVKFYPDVDGLKTGFTNEAKYCLTATAKKDNMRVIAVVMGADTTKKRNADVSKMLDYAFGHFDTKPLYQKGETITTLKLLKAEQQLIDIQASQSISMLLKKGESAENIQTETIIHDDIQLPIQKGTKVGELIIKKNNEVLSKTPLTVNEHIKSASYLTLFKRSVMQLTKNN